MKDGRLQSAFASESTDDISEENSKAVLYKKSQNVYLEFSR